MPDKMPDDHIREFAHLDTTTRRRELAAAGANATQRLESIKQSLKLPNLLAVETTTEKLVPGPGCIERFQVLGLAVGPNQSLQKKIFEQWNDNGMCFRVNYTIGFQFMGYGAYCLSFEKDAGNTGLFNNFFRDIGGYGVNLHRTILFTKETYENPNATQVQRLLLNGDGHTTSPDPNYLANLDRMVVAAKSQGIVVQVCLFMHHSVAGTPGAAPPAPVVLTGSAYDRYRAFYNTATTPTTFKPMQTHLIDGVVAKLLPHWNVVYEIGNELRVPNPNSAYGETHLKAWIDWAAGQIRTKDTSHLITTSTGIDNEAPIDNLGNIKFCSFHQGQWTANLNAACDRANSYAGKHVVFDDDGSARPIASVRAWAKAALDTRGGCRCSFNHKGISPFGAYNANWINTAPPAGESKPLDALIALRDARATSTSSCARE